MPLTNIRAKVTGRSGAVRECTVIGTCKRFPHIVAIAFDEPFMGSNGYDEDLTDARWEEVLLSEYGQQWRVWFCHSKHINII